MKSQRNNMYQMKIIPISAFQDNYIWLIVNDNNECFCVDPGDAKPVYDFISSHNLTLNGIMLTHHHFDHVGGVADLLKSHPQLKIYGPDDPRIPWITDTLKDGDTVNILNIDFDILSIPGHTSTHLAFHAPKEKILFCGDTLFSAGCGRVFDGTIEQLFSSLTKINKLDKATQVYCAHEYTLSNCQFAMTIEPKNNLIEKKIKSITQKQNTCTLPSTLEVENQINPFLRSITGELISENFEQLSPFDAFRKLRKMKDIF